MIDQRAAPRLRTYIGAQVVFNGRKSTIDCLIRNRSSGGVKLVFSAPVTFPSEFELLAPKLGESRVACVKWRGELEAGVELIGTSSSSVISIEAARIIRQLRAENEKLGQRVSQLSEPS